jgi:hypothetical protein
VDQHHDYIQDDWSRLLDAPPHWSKSQLAAAYLELYMFWSRSHRQHVASMMRTIRGANWGVLKPYSQLQSFLLSYVLLTSGVDKIELLSTQISLWNTARAIAMTMALGALSALIIMSLRTGLTGVMLSSGVAYFLLAGVALAVENSAYARVCSTLFALAYIVTGKESGPNAKNGI